MRRILRSTVKRSDMKPRHLYYDRMSEQYAWTPDGIGCFWYDTAEEAITDGGLEYGYFSVSTIEDL